MMLKKKKNGDVRPESPGSRRRKGKRGMLPLRRYNTSRSMEVGAPIVFMVELSLNMQKYVFL